MRGTSCNREVAAQSRGKTTASPNCPDMSLAVGWYGRYACQGTRTDDT